MCIRDRISTSNSRGDGTWSFALCWQKAPRICGGLQESENMGELSWFKTKGIIHWKIVNLCQWQWLSDISFFRSSNTQQVVSSVESELPTFSFPPSREKPLEGDITSNSSWAIMGPERYIIDSRKALFARSVCANFSLNTYTVRANFGLIARSPVYSIILLKLENVRAYLVSVLNWTYSLHVKQL